MRGETDEINDLCSLRFQFLHVRRRPSLRAPGERARRHRERRRITAWISRQTGWNSRMWKEAALAQAGQWEGKQFSVEIEEVDERRDGGTGQGKKVEERMLGSWECQVDSSHCRSSHFCARSGGSNLPWLPWVVWKRERAQGFHSTNLIESNKTPTFKRERKTRSIPLILRFRTLASELVKAQSPCERRISMYYSYKGQTELGRKNRKVSVGCSSRLILVPFFFLNLSGLCGRSCLKFQCPRMGESILIWEKHLICRCPSYLTEACYLLFIKQIRNFFICLI